jgi:hypothetical protein
MLTPTGMTAVKEVPAAVAAPDVLLAAGAEPDQTDPNMHHLECNYQMTPYRWKQTCGKWVEVREDDG